jgi:hypothetical protein
VESFRKCCEGSYPHPLFGKLLTGYAYIKSLLLSERGDEELGEIVWEDGSSCGERGCNGLLKLVPERICGLGIVANVDICVVCIESRELWSLLGFILFGLLCEIGPKTSI